MTEEQGGATGEPIERSTDYGWSSAPPAIGQGDQTETDDSGVAIRSAYVAIGLGCASSLICLLTLIAILHTRRPIGTNLQFVFSLLCSDLLTSTSVISKLSYEVRRSAEPSPCATIFMDGLRMTAHIAAFFNLCLIAVDMHVAILHPLRYSTIIDTRRVKILISISWSLAFLLGFSALYVPSTSYSPEPLPVLDESSVNTSSSSSTDLVAALITRRRPNRNESDYYTYPTSDSGPASDSFEPSAIERFCVGVFAKEYDSLFVTLAILILSAIIMISIYVKIFCTIKRIQKTDDETAKNYGTKLPKPPKQKWAARLCTRRRSELHCSNSMTGTNVSSEASKTRRGLVTTMIILAVFCVCFLPYFLADAASAIIFFYFRTFLKVPVYEISGPAAEYMRVIQHYTFFLYDILMLNSILDPVIYALRMREVRVGYRKLLRIENRFVRRSATGLSTRFGTCEGTTSGMTEASGSNTVRRGMTVPDLVSRNGRSTTSFISQRDTSMSYEKLVENSNPNPNPNPNPSVVACTHDRIDLQHAYQGEVAACPAGARDRSSIMSTSLNSNKTSSSLVEHTRPTSRNSE